MKLMNGLRTMKSEKENGDTFAERLLLFFSKEPGTDDYEEGKDKWNLDTALSLLCRVYQNFMSSIVGKQILDFGCGSGYQTVALARNGARYVLGIDTNAKRLNEARDLAGRLGLQQQVEFAARLEDRFRSRFDMAISQNSFEHFANPSMALKEMKSALNPRGQILITFGPPWYSPYGSHMHFFTKVPYVNIIFHEQTVMNVRAHFRTDGATKYEEVESGLNKMTVAKFEQVVANAGLSIQYRKYACVKRLDFLAKLPILRELAVNHISCTLIR